MCVIIYKPANTAKPSKKLLAEAYAANPHGCGFCSPSRSFKTLDFKKFWTEFSEVDESEPILIHFRYATDGSIKDSNCHPFYDSLTDTYFMHNGVLPIRAYKDKTDSETAFNAYFVPSIALYGLDSIETHDTIKGLLGGSKFAFMQGDNVTLYGRFERYNGLLCSNLRFLRPYYNYVG